MEKPMKELLEQWSAAMHSDDVNLRNEALLFFYYMTRGGLHMLNSSAKAPLQSETSTQAREYLSTLHAWLSEELGKD
jgi:hypothetical protein